MDRVSTAGGYASLLAGLQAAQARQTQAQNDVSTGKLGTDLKAYAGHADTLTATKAVQARTKVYIDTNTALADKLSAQDLALTELGKAADGARQAVTSAIANGDASGLMAALQGAFGQATGALNVQYQGRYLLGGGAGDRPPVTAASLESLSGGAAAVDGVFQDDGQGEVSRLDDSTSVRTGVNASDVGKPLLRAFADLQAFSAGQPFAGTLTAAQTAYLQQALTSFKTAAAGVVDATAGNGAVQNRVDQTLSALQDRAASLKGVVGDLTDVDLAEAATRLQLAQVAVQASAQVFSNLQGSSLLNVLK